MHLVSEIWKYSRKFFLNLEFNFQIKFKISFLNFFKRKFKYLKYIKYIFWFKHLKVKNK